MLSLKSIVAIIYGSRSATAVTDLYYEKSGGINQTTIDIVSKT